MKSKVEIYITDTESLIIDDKTLKKAKSLNRNRLPISDRRTKGAKYLKQWAENKTYLAEMRRLSEQIDYWMRKMGYR